MNKISVAVVDDNEKIVETICNELERDEEINIVGKAKNGEEAFDIIKKTNPDVVVLDLIMPKMDGLSLMNKIHKDGSIIFYNYISNKQWNSNSGCFRLWGRLLYA